MVSDLQEPDVPEDVPVPAAVAALLERGPAHHWPIRRARAIIEVSASGPAVAPRTLRLGVREGANPWR